MKKLTKLILIVITVFTWGYVAHAQTSTYCSTPSGHLNDPNFGDANARILLTITNIDANNISVKVAPNTDAGGAPIDFLQVNPVGAASVTVGTDEGTLLSEYEAILYFETPPTDVTMTIFWSNTNWSGRWMAADITVPFSATCEPAVADIEAPTAFTATKGTELSTSVELLLNATDNSGNVMYTVSYGSEPTTVNIPGKSEIQKSYFVTGLTPSTTYTFSIVAKDGAGNTAANNPIVVTATTTSGLTTAAPTPPAYAEAKVISIFSDAFSNLTGTDFNPGWGQSTQQSIIQVGTDNVMKYSNFNYQGTLFTHIFPVATGMKYLHIDVWTETETAIQVFPICWNGTGNEPEKFVTLTLAPGDFGTWKSYDIPLTDFTSQGLTMVDVYQMKLVGTGGKTVYLDNIYFYDPSTTVDTELPTAFTATKGTVTMDAVELLLNATDNSDAIVYTISYGEGPTVLSTSGLSGTQKTYTITGLASATEYNFSIVAKDAAGNIAANSPIIITATTLAPLAASPTPTAKAVDVLSIYSDVYTAAATGQEYQSWWNANWSSIKLADNGNAQKIVTTNGGGGVGIQFDNLDLNAMSHLHIDIYPTTATVNLLKYNVVPFGGGGNGWTSFSTLVANQWNSVDILVSDLGLGGTPAFQVGFGTFEGDGNFYLDNIYFYNDTATELSQVSSFESIACYPNPLRDQLTVSAQSNIKEVIVRNLVGQTVKTISINSVQSTFDLSDISAGNYFVTVKLSNGQTSTQKLIKI